MHAQFMGIKQLYQLTALKSLFEGIHSKLDYLLHAVLQPTHPLARASLGIAQVKFVLTCFARKLSCDIAAPPRVSPIRVTWQL